MKKFKVLQGAEVKHWLDKRLAEHKPISCPGNYIRIPASAWVKFQEIRNRAGGKHKSLFEQNQEFETVGGR